MRLYCRRGNGQKQQKKGLYEAAYGKGAEGYERGGHALLFLMPAFEALYLPFDFTYIYKKQSRELQQEKFSNLQLRRAENRDLQAAAAYMEAWLSKRYEVYAKRDFSYIERLKREIESENGCLELLFEKDTLAGMKAYWGMDKPEERLLFCEENYSRLQGDATPAIMGRIVNLPEFLSCIRLRETAEKEEYTVILGVEDEFYRKMQAFGNGRSTGAALGQKGFAQKQRRSQRAKKRQIFPLRFQRLQPGFSGILFRIPWESGESGSVRFAAYF